RRPRALRAAVGARGARRGSGKRTLPSPAAPERFAGAAGALGGQAPGGVMIHHGGCHCGAIVIDFESAVSAEETEVRACQCTFCRKHGSRAVSDPGGKLTIAVRDE